MQKLMPFPPAVELTRRQKTAAWFRQKKEWVKLNESYLIGTVAASTCAYASAYIAEKAGVDRAHATTWIAGLSAYISGTATIVVCWAVLHKEKYAADKSLLKRDVLKMIGSTILAQAITWMGSWSSTYLAVSLGAANWLAVTVQQAADRIIFIPLFNFLNRNRVKEMEQHENNIADKKVVP